MLRSDHAAVEERLAGLHHGPLKKNRATIDFEVVLNAFISQNTPPVTINRLQEIEVTIETKIYNLSKIIEHQPEIEHINFAVFNAEQNALATKVLQQLTAAFENVNTTEISEPEARAILYYSMGNKSNNAFEKINRFLREHGKIQDLTEADTIDLRSMMFVIAYYTKAIISLRILAEARDEKKEEQQIFRGEKYATPRLAKAVIDKRTQQILTREAGFFSTSQDKYKGKAFTIADKEQKQKNILVVLKHIKNAHGADVSKLSEVMIEQEVSFAPGTRFVFVKSPLDENLLYAIPVRSIDETYDQHYRPELIDIRRELLQYLDNYTKQPNTHHTMISIMDTFCGNIFNYHAAEMVYTFNACKDTLEQLKLCNIHAKNIEALNYFSGIIAKISESVSAIIRHELAECNGDVLQAAEYVYAKRLQKPYTEPDVSSNDLRFTINDVTIERPNHGLTHVVRKALYIPVIYRMFLSHAKDNEFKRELTQLSHDQLKLIQIAILFSVSGRESELGVLGSRENLPTYMSYRLNSRKYFMKYVIKKGLFREGLTTQFNMQWNEFIDYLAEQIQYFGAPAYLNSITAAAANPEEAPDQIRVYHLKICLYNIMNMAHNIDLMRCYHEPNLRNALEEMLTPLTSQYLEESFSKHGMQVLLKMANDCLAATGDRQYVAWHRGALKAVNHPYGNAFVGCSTNAMLCLTTCYLANPVFAEIAYDKLQIDPPHNKLKFTAFQKVLLSADVTNIHIAMSSPEFDHDEMSEIHKCLLNLVMIKTKYKYDTFWSEFSHEINTNEDLEPADLTLALYFALINRDTNLALTLINKETDLTSTNNQGETPLYLASVNSMPEVVCEIMKKAPATVNQATDQHVLPIMRAAANEYWLVVSELLKSSIIDLSGRTGTFILSKAIDKLQLEVAHAVLAKQVVIELNIESWYEGVLLKPLSYAVDHNLLDLTKELIKRGALINAASTYSDNNFLQVAILKNHWDMVALLAEEPSVDIDWPYFRSHHSDIFTGTTLMNIAIFEGQAILLSTLIKRQARCDQGSIENRTAVEVAIIKESPFAKQIITAMMSYDIPPKKEMPSRIMLCAFGKMDNDLINHAFNALYVDGKCKVDTALLHHACHDGNADYVEKILTMHAQNPSLNINGKIFNSNTRKEETALSIAVAAGRVDIVKLLIRHGADINTKPAINHGGVIESAAINNQWELVNLFMNVREINPDSQEPTFRINELFYYAAYHRQSAFALQLMKQNDFHMNYVGTHGNTALLCAIEAEDHELIENILRYSDIHVEINTFNHKKNVPVLMAAHKKDWKTVATIIDHAAFDITDDTGLQSALLVTLNSFRKTALIEKIGKRFPSSLTLVNFSHSLTFLPGLAGEKHDSPAPNPLWNDESGLQPPKYQ